MELPKEAKPGTNPGDKTWGFPEIQGMSYVQHLMEAVACCFDS